MRRSLPSPAACRALREEAGVSRDALARAVGVTAGAVYFWESGDRKPRAQNLSRYIKALTLLRESS